MLDAAHRKMMRRIVGWIRVEDEDWSMTGHRMKQRLDAALQRHPVAVWSVARDKQRRRLISSVMTNRAPRIVCRVYRWALRPIAPGFVVHRGRGRPPCRWTDGVQF